MIADGFGGAIVAGVRREIDEGIPKYIIGAQRINSSGQILWGNEGVIISKKADSQTFQVEISVDKWGNSLFVWRDRRTGRFQIYAQKISSNGSIMWGINGILISQYDSQKSVSGNGIASDFEGNAVLIWSDLRIEKGGLFGQRLNSNGLAQWGRNDIAISIRDQFQRSHRVISDYAGGAIICWYEIGTGSGWGIFAQQVSRNGNLGEVLVTSVSEPHTSSTPSQYVLYPGYPNPFNAEMVISYEIPEANKVSLIIFDLTGKEVAKLVDKNHTPGQYQVIWHGRDNKGSIVTNGIYFYQLRAGNFSLVRKALFIK